MSGELYRANKVRTIVGIRRTDVDAALPVEVRSRLQSLLNLHTINEPLHVGLVDEGYSDETPTPPMVVLEAIAVQVDAGVNEIPRATCAIAVGRDGLTLAAGGSDLQAASIAHVLERYWAKPIPCRIFTKITPTAYAGDGSFGDMQRDQPFVDEWVLLFDGVTVGSTRRGDPNNAQLVLHLAHFTVALTYSSSITADVAAGTDFPAARGAAVGAAGTAGTVPAVTMFGASAVALAGGFTLDTDFWGYAVPAEAGFRPAVGVKGFLKTLSSANVFDWAAFRRADLGGSVCSQPPADAPRTNTPALAALERFEPFTPGGTGRDVWGQLLTDIKAVRARIAAANSGRAVDRQDLLAEQPLTPAYSAVGYRYGVPIPFWLVGSVLGGLSHGRGFAEDIVGATVAELGPRSFWDLLAGDYQSRYQIAVLPMAGRAVVAPFQPFLDGTWTTIYEDEVFSWEDEVQTPVPIRGVVLIGRPTGQANALPNGTNPAAPGAPRAFQEMTAAFDSCEPGTFIFRSAPPWLNLTLRTSGTFAGLTAHQNPRAMAAVPNRTGPLANESISQALATVAGGVAGAVAAGLNPAAINAPTENMRATAYKMARALYQQARARYRSAHVTTRFRYDVGPGSILRFELPSDRYVRTAVGGQRDTVMTGMVLRVTLSLNQEAQSAATTFQVGFVRTEGETLPASPMFAAAHPFWGTAVYGVPWADAQWIRDRLGAGRDIEFRLGAPP